MDYNIMAECDFSIHENYVKDIASFNRMQKRGENL
jgi:hypothetical protein